MVRITGEPKTEVDTGITPDAVLEDETQLTPHTDMLRHLVIQSLEIIRSHILIPDDSQKLAALILEERRAIFHKYELQATMKEIEKLDGGHMYAVFDAYFEKLSNANLTELHTVDGLIDEFKTLLDGLSELETNQKVLE